MSAAAGAELARERSARGLTLEHVAAATRVRAKHLAALESGDLEQLPGPVYARGYLRTYAGFLELDVEPLLASVEAPPGPPRRSLSLGRLAPQLPAGVALTGPLLAGAGLVLLTLLFAMYAWRQFDSIRTEPAPAATPVVAAPVATPAPAEAIATTAVAAAPAPPAPPAARVRLLLIRTTEQTWLAVDVDGHPALGPNGRFFEPGQAALFAGRTMTVTSGKGASTLVTLDGRELGPLGPGVITRDFPGDN